LRVIVLAATFCVRYLACVFDYAATLSNHSRAVMPLVTGNDAPNSYQISSAVNRGFMRAILTNRRVNL
jgi:hypothetical protein